MPVIAINLSDKLLQEIRTVVDSGRYATLESFLEIGAFNQLALERGSSPTEIIERGHRRSFQNDQPPRHEATAGAKNKATSVASPSVDGSKRVSAEKVSRVEVIGPVTVDE